MAAQPPRGIPLARPIIALLALGLVASPAPAQGGLLGGLRKRAGEAVERAASARVNRELDAAAQKLVDRSFDTMFGGLDGGGDGSAGSSGRGGGRSKPGFSLLPNVPTESAYDFDATLTYELSSQRPGKPREEPVLLTMLLERDGKYLAARLRAADPKKDDAELTAIFDVGHESMVMLIATDKEKSSIAYSWKGAKQYDAGETPAPAGGAVPGSATVTTPEGKPLTFSSLGRRTILGREAEGYKATDGDEDFEVWVTRDAGLPSGRLMGSATSMKQMRGVMPSAYPTGLLLEVQTLDRRNGERGHLLIKSIEPSARVRIDMAEYPRLGSSK